MNHLNAEYFYRQRSARFPQTLESVFVKGHLRDLACELTVEQVFVNHTDDPIEAVYTFPLPHGAVLLDLVVTIGDRELKGSVIAKKQAERRYEEAITEGDGAIMLEQSDDGVCTINVGNLLPDERARLSYQYAYLLSWQQDTVKFRLPTTIAPRYGDPIAAGYQPHQVPVTDTLVENRFGLKLTIDGLLANALLDSPSHKVSVEHKEASAIVSLSDQQAFMDRENLKSSTPNRAAGQLAWDDIANSQNVLASFCPQLPGTELASLCLKVVVDCSGSMAGNSILQAQAGLARILDNLRETDTFNIVRFGAHHHAFFPGCVAAEGRNLRYARQAIDQLAADMGGTEMAAALDFAYALSDTSERPATVLLITDGEINAHKEVIRRAVKSGHRVFSVGVGAAVAEEFVKNIAKQTGGACELVTPNENMAEAIFRQFRRMYQPMVAEVVVQWPSLPIWQTPKTIGPVFAGDTVHVFAGFKVTIEGSANLILRLQDGSEIRQSIALSKALSPWRALPRLAAAERIQKLDPAESALAEKWAVNYQLLTQHTNFLILDIKEAEQKAEKLPKLVQVFQMLAAGWAGNGVVNNVAVSRSAYADPFMSVNGQSRNPLSMPLASFQEMPDLPMFDAFFAGDAQMLAEPFEMPSHSELNQNPAQKELNCAKPSDRQAIFCLIEDAGDEWLTVFIDRVLPALEQPAQVLFRMMTQDISRNGRDVAAAILFVLWENLGKFPSSLAFQNILALASQSPELIQAFRNIEIFNDEVVGQN